MIRWTGLAPWEFERPFSGSLTSTFLNTRDMNGMLALRKYHYPRTLLRNIPQQRDHTINTRDMSDIVSDSHYQSTLDAVYMHEVPWSEFPIVPSYPHYSQPSPFPITPPFPHHHVGLLAPRVPTTEQDWSFSPALAFGINSDLEFRGRPCRYLGANGSWCH